MRPRFLFGPRDPDDATNCEVPISEDFVGYGTVIGLDEEGLVSVRIVRLPPQAACENRPVRSSPSSFTTGKSLTAFGSRCSTAVRIPARGSIPRS